MSIQGRIGSARGAKVKRALSVQAALEWAFRVGQAQLELPPRTDIAEEGFGFGLEYVLLQRAALGCKLDGGQHKMGSYTHADAEVIAATVAGMPNSLGGIRMAIGVAEMARAGLTPNWMPGVVPRCVPVDIKRKRDLMRFFRADAACAIPAIYGRLEAAGCFYAIQLPTNSVLRKKIAHRLTRPVGRPSPTKVKRLCEDFEYQTASWDKPRRVIAKIEWHPGELFPKVGFIVTNLPMEPDWVVRFYNQRGTAEQNIKEGKYTFRWTRLSCKRFRDNEVRLQLHALVYNLATFLRCIKLPETMAN